MKRYETYKESGVEWLGYIPKHWKINKLKNLLSINDETIGENTPSDYLIQYVEISDVKLEIGIHNSTLIPFAEAPSRARRKVKSGDVIVSTVRTYLKAIAKITDCPDNLIVSTGFAVLRPNSIDSDFLGYLMISDGIINEIICNSVGVSYPAINSSQLIKIQIPVPPIPEQTQIASYLEYKTSLIDELIAKKQRKIELLKEQRTAIINQAVTRGLNPNAKMKPSGVEWIGEIPEGWEVKLFKRGIELLTDFEANGSFASIDENVEFSDESGFAWYVRATDLQNFNDKNLEKYRWVTKSTFEFLSKTQLIGGELLIAKRGEIGKVYLMPFTNLKATLAPNLYLVRLNDKLLPKYSHYYFTSEIGRSQLIINNRSTTLGALYKDDLKEITMIFPPISDQELIVEWLNQRCEAIDCSVGAENSKIEILKEFRQSLISEVVTGKIDVRDWQPVKNN